MKGLTFFMKIKTYKFAKCRITLKYFKLIEVQCNVIFLSVFGVELDVKNESQKCGRMHLSNKTPKASRANIIDCS